MQTTSQTPNGEPIPGTPISTPAVEPRVPLWQRVIKETLLVVVLVSLGGFFCTYILGVQVPFLSGSVKEEKPDKEKQETKIPPGVTLVDEKPHTVEVAEETRTTLGIRKNGKDLSYEAKAPVAMKPLILAGSTMLDPTKLARIKPRFTPDRVVKICEFSDLSPKSAKTEFREYRTGDPVKQGDCLALLYSETAGSKKNDLLDALVQLQLDQKIYDDMTVNTAVIPKVILDTQYRLVQGDRNAINRALNNLKVWDIPQKEIDDLHKEAELISADKEAWYQTEGGKFYQGKKQAEGNLLDNPWGKITLEAPFDGIIVERNLHVNEMITDPTVNLFQIADVRRLLVIANCPEDQLPVLESYKADNGKAAKWTIQTAGKDAGGFTGMIELPGTIEDIGYIIDPNQHTAIIKGYVDNPGLKLRAGQYVAAAVPIPPPAGVVEIPISALLEDGKQSLVFVQPDPAKPIYTMRRVKVTHRFDKTAFVISEPIPEKERLTPKEMEEGLLPKEPLRPGDHVLQAGIGELKLAVLIMESKKKESKD